MDSTIIQEIANQLGMAVDQAGQFITEQLPSFAAMKAIYPLSWIIGSAIVAVISTVVFIKCLQAFKSEAKKSIFSEDIDVELTSIVGLVISAICMIVAVIVLAINVPNFIAWLAYPEAMLLDMALKAVV